MAPVPTISVPYVVRLIELAERDGVSGAELLRRAEIDPIAEDRPDVRIPTDAYYRLWAAAMSALGDPSFPLRLAGAMDTESFDALGFAVITSETYGDALTRIQRYLPFVTDGASWAIDRDGGAAALTFTQAGERRPEHRYVAEFSMAHLVIVGRKLTREPWELLEVRFTHPRPPDVGALEAFFRAPLVFDAPASQLRLPGAALALPFVKADARLASFFDRHIESVLERTHPEPGFLSSVRRLLAEALMQNAYSLEDLARRLALSPRTLRRRLEESGVTYTALLDDLRRELAERYLRERRMAVGEIAYALGYSEPAAFHRAFRRWTRMTPAAYRATHRPAENV